MYTDHILENLADGEEESCTGKVDHWSEFAQYTKNQDGLENVEQGQADQWEKLVQDIETDVAIGVIDTGT